MQQYLAQQKAKAQAQAEQQKKSQQATQQQKASVQQKQSTPANAKKGEPAEYGSYLRDSAEETGGTATQVTLNYSPSADTQQDVRESPLSLDLIGKVAGVSGDTVTLQDAKGQQIDVDAPDHNLQEGNYINVQGTALSGADGNIYIVKDPESGMDVSLNQISQEDFNQKAAEQEQAASEFAAEHPEESLIESTGTTIDEQPAPTESSESSSSGESWYNSAKNWVANDIKQTKDVASAVGSYVVDKAESVVENWTWGKTASVAVGVAGAGLIIASGVTSVATYGAATPASVAIFNAGVGLVSGAVGTFVVQDFYQEAEQTVEERHPGTSGNNNIRENANALMQEVDSHMEQQ